MSSIVTSRTRGLVALGLLLLLVLGVVVGTVVRYRADHLTTSPYSLLNSGDPVPDPAEGRKAVAVASQYVLRLDTLDTTKPQEYLDGIRELSTTKSELNQVTAEQFAATFEGQTLKSKGLIVTSALRDQDVDSATVLVLHIRETVGAQGSEIVNLRAVVSLQKVDGKWLVDNISNGTASQEVAP